MADTTSRRRLLREMCAPALTQGEPCASILFNVKDGKDLPDTEGTELANVAEVRKQAIRTAGEMIRSTGYTVWSGTDWRMDVTDEAGDRLFTLRFSADDHGPQF